MDKAEKKALKKEFKKAKHKAVRPWKGMSVFSGIFAVVFTVGYVFCSMFDNTIAAFANGTFWSLENEDESAQYYTLDYDSVEDMAAYGDELCKQVEAEGAALLMNENQALPLKKGAKVTLMSNSSNNLVYGGTGSGNIDASKADNLKTACEDAGLEVNDVMWEFYGSEEAQEYAREVGGTVSLDAAVVSEMPWDVYTDEVKDSISEYPDAAIVTFSRVGGEGADLTFDLNNKENNYLALNADEKDLMKNLAEMKAAGDVKKIIVLINSANPLQVDFLKDNAYDVDAVLWIGDVGITGVNAVGEILSGQVNPSGSLVDTYCYDNFSAPAMYNNNPVTYAGDVSTIPDSADTYEIYQEGIYVGYKYYETRYEDKVMGTGNAGDYAYGDAVAFPFGHGLSYTNFEYSDYSISYNESTHEYTMKVKVTNVGSEDSKQKIAGKETVQIYVQSPYTDYDKENLVEKSSVSLCGFAKTKLLEVGESQELTIVVDGADIASYDAYGAETYIMDAGNYYFTAATDAHDAINNILAAKGYTKADGMDADGNASMVASWVNPTLDVSTYAISKAGAEITNQLSDSDLNLYEGAEGQTVTYLSRNDWTGTWPTDPVQIKLTDALVDDLQLVQYDAADYEAVDMPTLGAKNDLTLYDMMNLDYDDPQWDALLDQLTFDEMVALIGDSFHWTMPVESVQAPGTRDENGPQGLTASLFGGDGEDITATAFTSEDVMAATFNIDLMTEIGKVIGNNCLSANVTCLYGPGNNIHRTPFGGRNFEYYSEDGFLSGKMSGYEIGAIENKGVHVVMKHFALNDSEQDRIGLGVWLGEQAAREIYLKAFQDAFEEGNAGGTMVAYTRWGAIWSGGNHGLMTGIMRNEWGNNGLTITDNVLTKYVNGVDGIMAGGVTTFDAMLPYVVNQLPDYENDPVIVSAMREACHHNLYAIANSIAMNGIGADTKIVAKELKVVTILRMVMIIFWCLFIGSLVIFILRKRKFKETEAYSKYQEAKKKK